MATTKEAVETNRAQELELIINELEELNHEANKHNIWIRTKWNLPNQKAWNLGTPETPAQGPHSLGVEHPSPAPHVWKWDDIEKYLLTLIERCPVSYTHLPLPTNREV